MKLSHKLACVIADAYTEKNPEIVPMELRGMIDLNSLNRNVRGLCELPSWKFSSTRMDSVFVSLGLTETEIEPFREGIELAYYGNES